MVFAAGLGTRLRPLTDTMPKALVPVSGEPLLGHVLRNLSSAGMEEAVVNVHHFAPMIKDWVRDNDCGLPVKISDESGELLDTGGGILNARRLLEAPLPGGTDRFLVHNVDILSNLDIKDFCEKFSSWSPVAVLVVSPRKTSRYLLFDPEDMRLLGWTNIETGEVRSPYPDIDLSRCIRLAFAGIHLLSRDIFPAFGEFGFEGKFSIMDFYIRACGKLDIRGYVPDGFRMIDVGKKGSVEEAEEFLQSL